MVDSPELMGVVEHSVAEQTAAGVDVAILSGDEARRMEPCLSKRITAVTYCPDDGRVSPIHTTIGYAKAAGRAGVEFLLNTAVTGVTVEDPGTDPG